MSERNGLERVGIRELRQNLSVYLRRVEDGETLEVTDRGRVVARLGPDPTGPLTRLQRMVLDGRATPPRRSILTLPKPIVVDGPSVSDTLAVMRASERG